jgi:hypothetical protein
MKATGNLGQRRLREVWPIGVALPSDAVQGTNGIAILSFCEKRDVCPVHETVRRRGKEYWIYRFSTRQDADDFRQSFGGKPVRSRGSD